MRLLLLALLLFCTIAANAAAQGFGAPLGSPSAPSLMSPGGHAIGATAPTRLRSLGPGGFEPAGPLGAGRERPAATQPLRPIERRLDCFEAPVAPDRDDRNRFLSRCPSNPAFN
jgi:hypothetical protein